MDRIDAAAAATYVIAAADSTFFVLDNSSSDIIPVSLKIRTARPDALNSTGKVISWNSTPKKKHSSPTWIRK